MERGYVWRERESWSIGSKAASVQCEVDAMSFHFLVTQESSFAYNNIQEIQYFIQGYFNTTRKYSYDIR